MAEELFDGIVRISVDDGNVVEKIAAMTEQVKALFGEMASSASRLSPLAGIDLQQGGGQFLNDVNAQIAEMERAATTARQRIGEIQTATQEKGRGPMYQRELGNLERMIALLDVLRSKYAEVDAANAVRAERNFGRVSSADEIMRRQEATVQRLMSSGIDETQARSYLGLPARSEQEKIERLEAQVREQFAGQRPTGTPVAGDDGGFIGYTRSPEQMLADIRGREAQANDPLTALKANAEAAQLTREQAEDALTRPVTAKSEAALEAEMARRERAFAGAVRQQEAAEGAIQKYEERLAKLKGAEVEAAERRAAALNDPRHGMLGMSSPEFIEADGTNLSRSAARREIETQLRHNATAQQALVAKQGEVASQEELTKLIQQKRLLALKELSLQERLAALKEKEMAAAGGGAGGGRGEGFAAGLFGSGEGRSNMAFQAGQAVKYFGLYTALAEGFRFFQEGTEYVKEYTLALNQLGIALNTDADAARGFASQYADVANEFAQGPTVGVQGATRYLQAFRNQDGSVDTSVGAVGARIGSLLANLEPEERQDNAMNDLIAISKSYGISAEGSPALLDQLTSVSRRYGYDEPGSVMPGVAAVADIGKESGFSPAQLAAMVAAVMRRTGTQSDAVGGDLKRFLGGQDETALQRIFQVAGVHEGNFYEKLSQLNAYLQTKPEAQRSQILLGAGNPRTGASVVAALSDFGAQQDAATDAQNAGGMAERIAKSKLDTIGGAFQDFTAKMQQAFVAVSESGLGDVLVFIIRGATGVVDVLTNLLNVFNQLPAFVKDTVAALGLLAIAIKLLGGSQAVAGGLRFGAAGASALVSDGLAGGLGGARTTIVAGASRFTSGLLAALNPWTLGIGAATIGITAFMQAQENAREAAQNFADTLDEKGRPTDATRKSAVEKLTFDVNPEDWARLEKAGFGLSGATDAAVAGPDARQAYTARLDAARAAIDPMTANEEQQALRKALDGAASSMVHTGDDIDEGVRLAEEKARLQKLQNDALTNGSLSPEDRKGLAPRPSDPNLPSSEVFGTGFKDVTVGSNFIVSQGMSVAETIKNINDFLTNLPKLPDPLGSANSFFTPTSGQAGLPELQKYLLQRIGRQTDITQQVDDLGAVRGTLLNARSAVSGDPTKIAQVDTLIDEVNKQWSAAIIESTKAKVEALKSNYTGDAQGSQIRSLLTQAITQVATAGDVNSTVQLLNGIDRGFLAQLKANLEAQRAMLDSQFQAISAAASILPGMGALGAIGALGKMANPFQGALDTIGKAEPLATFSGADTTAVSSALAEAKALASAQSGDSIEQARAQVKAAQARLNSLSGRKGTADYYTALKSLNDAKWGLAQAEFNASQAHISAGVTPGDPAAEARESLRAAQARLRFTRDPVEYYNALKALNQAKYELGRIELQNANALDLRNVDITNPVAVAQEKVREAQRQLAFDRRRGASGSVILQDEAQLRQARVDAEGSAWQQQFQDQRTNYELYRTSLATYLNYLRTQHDYLTAVKDKTRQQVDQLNEVDAALKGLIEGLQGQWNLGEIKVPTAYEMRRQLAAGGMGATNTAISYVNISLNGSSMSEMKEILEQYVGQPIVQTTASTPTRV